MRRACSSCGSRRGAYTFETVVGPDGLYTEERCALCDAVFAFTLILSLDAKTCHQIVTLFSSYQRRPRYHSPPQAA
jgi:hypothetical protein